MYFGQEPQDALDKNRAPVLMGVLMISAFSMVLGVVTLFGIEGAAEAAADMLFD